MLKLNSEWDRLSKKLHSLDKDINARAKEGFELANSKLLEEMISHIDKQDLNWKALKKETIEKKGDGKVYVETSSLRDSLDVFKLVDTEKHFVSYVGVPKGVIHSPSGIELDKLLIYLEYGTSKIPSRPLIRPTWESFEPKYKKIILDVLKDCVGR